MQNNWSIRPTVMDTIRECYEINEEMFAPPLIYSTALNSYRSALERDSIFGKKYEAYSENFQLCICIGFSFIPPEH